MGTSEDTKKKEDNSEDIVDTLELSDEDFMKLEDPADIVNSEVDTEKEEPKPIVDKDVVVDPEILTESDKDIDKDVSVKADEDVDPALEISDTDKKIEVVEDSTKDKEEVVEIKEKAKPTIDYEAEYKKITASFKANGHEMSVKNSDDAIRLMQMGANYQKKMIGLKPSLRILKLLEKNDLMNEGSLNFLIDLHNKNPEAITKLVKDSGMDPLDVNVKADSKYVPTQRIVNDSELDLDTVLEDIQDTSTYQETLNVVTNVWDIKSRNVIAASPQIITTINEHMADGTYSKVMSAVTYERSMGKLIGLSDIEAYKEMGDKLFATGQIGQPKVVSKVTTDPIGSPTKIDSQTEVKRKERKKAVSPTKSTGTPTAVSYDPLSMSDDDFAKIDPRNFKTK